MMREITYRDAVREALFEEMSRQPGMIIIGEDLLPGGGTFGVHAGFGEHFAARMFESPISESAIVGVALGAALAGGPAVAEIMYSDFLCVAMDEVVNQAAKIRYMTGGQARVPLVVRSPIGMTRVIAAQHSQSLEAWFAHIPGLRVVMPATPADAKGLLKTALRGSDPVMFFEPKLLYASNCRRWSCLFNCRTPPSSCSSWPWCCCARRAFLAAAPSGSEHAAQRLPRS